MLIWPDIFGLRPAFRQMGKRLAESGYSVLVVNPFYRSKRASVITANGTPTMADTQPMTRLLNETTHITDAKALIAWLDQQPSVAKNRKVGTQGYCMGGPLVVRSAAAVADRIGAGASFHGGGLVTDKPDSPHLLAPRIRARMYFGVAANDDQRQPEAKDQLRAAFAAANVPAEVEVYSARHGWCVPDMPVEAGAPIYNAAEAERAWGKLLALYRTALA